MPNLPAVQLDRPNPLKHPWRWLRWRWHQPNPHTESKLHRACRDFAGHFKALRVQFPVFYLFGGIGAVAGGIVAASEHLDALAIGEWSAAGLIGPPGVVCIWIFAAVWWRTPTKQRDDARSALSASAAQVTALNGTLETLTNERDEALAKVVEAEAKGPTFVGGTHYHYGEDPDPTRTARLQAEAQAEAAKAPDADPGR